jgi:hypothetical protein
MQPNSLVILLTGLIPTLVGFIWYNPKVMGTVWMQETGLTPESGKNQNMMVVFGVSILLSVMLAGSMLPITIHQAGLESMLLGEPDLKDPNSELSKTVASLMSKYGTNYRTFKHGALHGFLASLFLLLPVIATNGLFEQKSWRYIGVNWAFWAICLTLMGGCICAFA